MGRAGRRVAVAGATGALGSVLIEALAERGFPIRELIPIATPNSVGEEIELWDVAVPVLDAPPADWTGIDILFLCTPTQAALELARLALKQSVPVIDLSGAFVLHQEVPFVVAGLGFDDEVRQAPLVSCPAGSGLAWGMLLSALDREARVQRAVGTVLTSASSLGAAGFDRLSQESIAVFNPSSHPTPESDEEPLAFDCRPGLGGFDENSESSVYEARLMRDLTRILGHDVSLMVTAVRVPTFAGDGIVLEVELEKALGPAAAALALAKVSGIEIWDGDEAGPSTRCGVGQDFVIVSRLRSEAARPNVLHLWAVADPLRLAALNALKIAEAKLRAEA